MSFLSKVAKKLFIYKKCSLVSVRHLNLLEYNSKYLLKKHGVIVQDFCMVDKNGTQELDKFTAGEYVIKSQILAGGRGKGHFDTGFKGGIQFTKNKGDIKKLLDQMLGNKLITKQTPKEGIEVKKIMVANGVSIKRETYFCILMDRQNDGAVIVASPAGGMDIEDVAVKTPHLLKTLPIDVFKGVTDEMANEVAEFLEFKGELKAIAADQVKRLWNVFLDVDATQLEINPLVETNDNKIYSVDVKLNIDDNAKFRQKEIFSMQDSSEEDPREVEAAKYNLNYIGMDGNIGCLVNGAGLAMATMDIIKLNGGEPANFLDCGGGVREEQVRAAFKILTSDKTVKSIFVNIFGGIVNCATIASGIVSAMNKMSLDIPLIVRLQGTNATEARKIIKDSKLNIMAIPDFDDAAQKAVNSAK